MLDNFKGNLSWVHAREGHAGKVYWPGGQSGVTLDPGVDLGYIDKNIVSLMYRDIMTPKQFGDVMRVRGYRGIDAKNIIPKLRHLTKFRISREEAEHIFPYVADKYWNETVERWPQILDAPPSVQTAILSLTYNRGPENRHLNILKTYFRKEDWEGLGNELMRMQQNHKLPGIRLRRRQEGKLILDNWKREVEFQKVEYVEPLPLKTL